MIKRFVRIANYHNSESWETSRRSNVLQTN